MSDQPKHVGFPDGTIRCLATFRNLPTLDASTADYIKCAYDSAHGGATEWLYAEDIDACVALCDKCAESIKDREQLAALANAPVGGHA